MNTTLTADELNDFIGPAPECVKPVKFRKTNDSAAIVIGADGEPTEDEQQLPVAKITLSDCLACSGCITSSEAILVEQQSVKELMNVLAKNKSNKTFVASIAPQVRVSLAQGLGLSLSQTDAKLRHLFHEQLGFAFVVGTEIGRAISLEMSVQEAAARKDSGPVITSICPGWTCYAEKSKPEILPYLSQVRSPQQITGNLLKRLVPVEPSNIYHVSVMPCFDKKLEASRPEFAIEGAREVDMVITAREIVDLCSTHLGVEFSSLPESQQLLELAPANWPAQDSWKSNVGTTSGGYLAHLMLRILETHVGSTLKEIPGRNKDIIEYQVMSGDGTVLYRGAQVYGFRNIQNVVRKLKPAKGRGAVVRRRNASQMSDPQELNYIEMMACPGGCGSGGGQLAPAPDLQEVYDEIPRLSVVPQLIDEYLGGMGIEATQELVTTTFKPIEDTLQNQPLALSAEW